jgi:hypothetical protein
MLIIYLSFECLVVLLCGECFLYSLLGLGLYFSFSFSFISLNWVDTTSRRAILAAFMPVFFFFLIKVDI